MSGGRRNLVSGSLAMLLACGLLVAHPDDPKGLVKRVAYKGPGYRAGAVVSTDTYTAAPEGPALGFPASGIELQSWLTLAELNGGTSGNDCWGYVSPSGREYALVGVRTGTAFVEITDPANAVLVDHVAGPTSLWRDIKSYQSYAYAVTEGTGSRIQVIDLSDIDNGNATLVHTVTTDIIDAILNVTSTHNVAIDEASGFLYRCGGGGNGLRIYSLANPALPVFVGAWSDRYVHDAQIVTYTTGPYAGRQIAFCCSGFNGGSVQTGLDILDVTDKQNILSLDRLQYANGRYSHQAWLSPDRRYLYLNDELDESQLGILTNTKVIDVQDLENAVELTPFSNSSTAIGHNLYTLGNLIFEANYRSGLRVFDATDPLAPVEFAYFDTWETDDNPSFNGLWSVYPYLPSGTIIASDLEKGLFVFTLISPPGGAGELALSLLEGMPDLIDPDGGTTVRVEVQEVSGSLDPSTLFLNWSTSADAGAAPAATGREEFQPMGGGVYEAAFPSLVCMDRVMYHISADTTGGASFRLPASPSTQFQGLAARRAAVTFEDDMETDLGWARVSSGLSDGAWDLAPSTPIGGGDRGDPPTDYDGSGQCWMTDNLDGDSDVDGGSACLDSPMLDVSSMPDPWVSYARWFVSMDVADDQFRARVSGNGGATWVTVQTVDSIGGWELHTFRIADFIAPGGQFMFRVCITDDPDNSISEGAMDAFRLFTPLCVDGDTNGDDVVNVGDLLDLLAGWGACPGAAPICPADFNGDGDVGVTDLLTLLSNWG